MVGMYRVVVMGLGVLLSLAPAAARAAGDLAPSDACPSTAGFTASDEALSAFAAAVKAGGPVDVLAIGSATTVAQDNNAEGVSFPYHMIEALHAALPKVDFQLTVKGGRGMTAQDMLPVLDSALAAHAYPLVIWQTGTVEAVRGLRPDTLHAALATGVGHVRARGGDSVLVDPNYSRALRANTETDPYIQVMRQVADLPGVVLFPRYELTRSWMDKASIDVERVPKAERAAAVDQLHRCVGLALAGFLLNGLRQNPP
jgi:acyl-CoA thioesterase I